MFPCILHWNQNHFIVLYRVKNSGKYYVADPGKGLLTYSEKEFKEGWISTCLNGAEKGIALFIQPTPAFYEQEEKETKEKRSFKFLFGYLKQYRRYFGANHFGVHWWDVSYSLSFRFLPNRL